LERGGAACVGIPLVSLSELHGRPGLLALERAGAETRLGVKVRQVLAEDGDGDLTVVDEAGATEADAVIVAVPNDRVAALLPPGSLADPEAPSRRRAPQRCGGS